MSRIEGRGGLLSLTGEDSEPGRVVSVELVVEEDAEVISDMNHVVLGRPERLNACGAKTSGARTKIDVLFFLAEKWLLFPKLFPNNRHRPTWGRVSR